MPTVRQRCASCPNWRPCPTHQRAYDRRRPSGAKRGYRTDPNSTWQRLTRIVKARDPLCRWELAPCTRPTHDIAHIRPRRSIADDTVDNVRGLCHAHHSQETATRESFGRGKK